MFPQTANRNVTRTWFWHRVLLQECRNLCCSTSRTQCNKEQSPSTVLTIIRDANFALSPNRKKRWPACILDL